MNLLSRTITSCTAQPDDIVYGKVGTSSTAFETATAGRTVTNVGQQGKYFYITFDKPPHAVLHLGMTGWIKFNTEDTSYYGLAKEKDKPQEWPPRFEKFLWKVGKETSGEKREELEVAFVDPRRLARIRLVDCEASEIRQQTPLKENGPDPVVDKDVFTLDFLTTLMRKKKVPVKALLLNQANISGIGNWVADEVLYQARIHPEQYSNTFDDAQIKCLHDSIMDICTTAVDLLADMSRFPEQWLMKYRWNKGKKDSNVLPNGEKIVHLTVGGRTSAIVPSVQKKTAAVAGDVESGVEEATSKPARGRKRKAKAEETEEDEEEDDEDESEIEEPRPKKGRKSKPQQDVAEEADVPPAKPAGRRAKKDVLPAAAKSPTAKATANGTKKGKKATPKIKDEDADVGATADEDVDEKPKAKKGKTTPKKAEKAVAPGERRSGRMKR